METCFGIDIGGTNVKIGLVNSAGELLQKDKYPTADLYSKGDFLGEFISILDKHFTDHSNIDEVGIGVPGTITKDRRSTVDLPNIPSFSHVNFVERLESVFPAKKFYLENDASAAALGELVFAENEVPDDYVFITLGTGIGGACIMDGKIFVGGGNAMEIGHMLCTQGRVEEVIGKQGIKKIYKDLSGTKKELDEISTKSVAKAALQGNEVAQKVYYKMGKVLGECIVSTIRVLDIETFVIGGGVSKTYEFIKPGIYKTLEKYLPKYYMERIDIKLASLGNEAGILGAASLCFGNK